MATTAKNKSLYTDVMELIWHYIEDNSLKPGDRLPPETTLATTFGVSRNTIREACRALQMLGVLSTEKRVGMIIQDFSLSNISKFLPYTVHAFSTPLPAALEARYWFETSIVDYVIRGVTPEDIALLRKVQQQFVDALLDENYDAFLDAEMRFHKRYYASTQNPIIEGLGDILITYNEIHWNILSMATPPSSETVVRTLKEHKLMIDYLEKKETEKLRNLVHEVYFRTLHTPQPSL